MLSFQILQKQVEHGIQGDSLRVRNKGKSEKIWTLVFAQDKGAKIRD